MKRCCVFILILVLCFSCFACSKKETSTAHILEEQMLAVDSLPRGEVYHSGTVAGESGYFSPHLMATVYGETAEERCFPLIEEYAIYLSSFAEPCEIAVFRCYARSDADRIAEMCLSRIEQLRVLLAGTSYRSRVDQATVRVDGKLVVMQILP